MNKITRKHIKYSEVVRYNKYLKYKAASDKYMEDRSCVNFDRLKKLSVEFIKYNKIHVSKFNRLTW